MTTDGYERMLVLCKRIAVEKDHAKFIRLVTELNDLLARKEQVLKHVSELAGANDQNQRRPA
jgi:hypothetical protein